MSEFKRKRVLLLGLIALAVCVGVINNRIGQENLQGASADYVKYEGEQMRLYEESEAVVSSAVEDGKTTATNAPVDQEKTDGTESTGNSKFKNSDDVTLVSSDNYSEMNEKSTYFEEARATMDMDRNEIISMLTEFIEENPDGANKTQATEEKLKIIDYMNKEKTVENLIKNKGFEDAFVVMTDNAVNITVNKQELLQSDVAKIVDIITRETGRPYSQIVVQNKV